MTETTDPRWLVIYAETPFCDHHGAGEPDSTCAECVGRKRFFDAADGLFSHQVRMERALGELISLKDGPRDQNYRDRKPAAWGNAREIVFKISKES